ncbi:MAG: hypothetical protein CL943_02870 [Candidatus Diapherotrites archaeon]|uniref:THUMP domain-containing protein n=1 Tax=Candidatus Iainarchaeum sp. TaxID=3101447 RepID=A0A2D6M1C9_9ARCH|nr:hypothetical protein [Candidatus Diapherotrites archaeon]|tara:strand:+ start:346 stop:1260 length:915 start_codon:yes stop_codon:yes gene_type:complete
MVEAIPKNTNCLLVKTSSEIALKSNQVRQYFTKKLVANIKLSLKKNNIPLEKITKGGGRLYIFSPDLQAVAKIMQTLVGVHAIALAVSTKFKEHEEIEKLVVEEAKQYLKKGDSFALRAKKSVEGPPSSKHYENTLGQAVMDSIQGLIVNLSKPEKQIFIEVRKRDFFVYFSNIPCLRGLPLGVEGNASFFFEGKKEELPAAYLLLYRGCNIFPVVEKKRAKLEAHINKLVPYNSYRGFVITEQKDSQKLVEERKIQAIGTADSGTTEKDFTEYKKFDSNHPEVVLRPLLLYPKELIQEKQKLF